MVKEQVVIIIPFYKDKINYNDQFSLKWCFSVLRNYRIIAIKPNSLNISSSIKNYAFNDVVSFDDNYFKNINGYNALMLSTEFYESFLQYQYMLIYQQDAFVFSDQLQYWCNQNYDYIGAPWLYPTSFGLALNNVNIYIKSYFYRRYNKLRNGVPNAKQLHNQVGNGGFSLRSVERFYCLLLKHQDLAYTYIKRLELEFNEDIFWSIALNRRQKKVKTPDYKTALKFAVETEPEIAFRLNRDKLPFGCHAWDKNLDFWQPILEKYGYDVNQKMFR